MTNVLRGPADKSVFRNDPEKWTGYIDPLPACDIADATDAVFDSLSTVKKSHPTMFEPSFTRKHIIAAAWDNRGRFDLWGEAETASALRQAPYDARDIAFARGTTIHQILEATTCDGEAVPDLAANDPAAPYLDSVRHYLADERPDVVAAEFLAYNRSDGYATTPDAVHRIDGRNVLVDYKTRTDSLPVTTRYPEEAAQVMAGWGAEYWIIDDGTGGAKRMHPLDIDGVRIVSIGVGGYRNYDVIEASGGRLWAALINFHHARSETTSGLFARCAGTDVPDSPSSATPDDPSTTGRSAGDRRVWLTSRLRAAITDHRETTLEQYALARVAHPDLPESLTPDFADEHLEILVAVVDQVEALHEEPFGDTDPAVTVEREAAATLTPQPEPRPRLARIDAHDEGVRYVEGSDGDPFPALKRAVEALPSSVSDRMLRWRHESREHGIVWNCMGRRSERALEQMRAAMMLAKACEGSHDESGENDHARAALAIVIGEETQLAIPVGAYIGNLSLDEARTLTKVATTLAEGGTAADALAVVA